MAIGLKSWKYIFCVPLLLALVLVTVSASYIVRTYSLQTAVEVGQRNLDQIQAIRGYYVAYILPEALDAGLPTDVRHKESEGNVPPPATFTHDVGDAITESGTTTNLYSPFPWPNRSNRVLNERQREAWEFLVTNPDGIYREFDITADGHHIVYVAYADKLSSETCVNCHNNHPDTPITGWSLGDTRGVLEVTVDIESLVQRGEIIAYSFSGIIGFLVMLTLVIGISVDRGIGKPLVNISEVALAMMRGEKHAVPHENRKDEVGILARALSKLTSYVDDHERVLMLEAQEAKVHAKRTEKLEALMGEFDGRINQTFSDIADAIRKIYDSTGYLSTNAEQTSSQISLISSATDEMAQNINSVSASGAELSQSITTVLDQVNQSRDISQSASVQANDANQKIQGLADAAQRIGEVVDLINDIANQTNLLALNATIEAARAGESGKGFAVVANEVKNLANQTAKATEEISSQIQNVQAETRHAVSAIAEVTGVVGNLNSLASGIAESINTQTHAVHEISNNALQTTTGTTEVTQGLISVSTAATSTGTMAARLVTDTESLRKLADHLGEEIQEFHRGIIDIQSTTSAHPVTDIPVIDTLAVNAPATDTPVTETPMTNDAPAAETLMTQEVVESSSTKDPQTNQS